MASSAAESKKIILEAIREHMLMHGATEWEKVRSRFPEVSEATWWRRVADVRKALQDEGVIEGSSRAVAARVGGIPKTEARRLQKVGEHLPATPSPAIIAGIPDQRARVTFDFLKHFQQIVADAELIREQLVKVDPDTGKTKVANLAAFDRNLARRLAIVQSWISSQELLYSYERMQELFRMVIEAVGKADSVTQAAIIAELRALNEKRGINLDGLL